VGEKGGGEEIEVEVMEMRECHIDDVARIEFDSFSTPWSPSFFQKAMRDEKTHAIVALVDGDVVGYAVFWVIGDYAEVGDIAVQRDRRGMGIGDRLLKDATAICRLLGVASLFLEVRESNTAARGLYRKNGFMEITRRKGYYSRPVENAIVLGLDVANMDSAGTCQDKE
jgi:ribosomal-protein-alanine N-acetyltransferase